MFLSPFSANVVCGTVLQKAGVEDEGEVAAAAEEVGVDIADALELLTVKDEKKDLTAEKDLKRLRV